jgi:hypothetical protein
MQHIALATGDIVASVRPMRAARVEFLSTPAAITAPPAASSFRPNQFHCRSRTLSSKTDDPGVR